MLEKKSKRKRSNILRVILEVCVCVFSEEGRYIKRGRKKEAREELKRKEKLE